MCFGGKQKAPQINIPAQSAAASSSSPIFNADYYDSETASDITNQNMKGKKALRIKRKDNNFVVNQSGSGGLQIPT
jgi:hypothetical protein